MKAFFFLLLIACSHPKGKVPKLPLGEKFLPVPTGKVHASCLNRHGSKLLALIERSRRTGQSCLEQLGTPMAKRHSERLEKLFQSKKLTYFCSEPGSQWEDQAAHASVDAGDDIPELGYHHPYISLQPKLVITGDLQELIFHEYFHNTGSVHGFTIEYPYACAQCCFPHYQQDSLLACRICQGNYTGVEDESYIQDFWEWSDDSPFKKYLRRDVTLRYALFKRFDSVKLWELYFANWDPHNLVARNLALRLSKKWKRFSTVAKKFSSRPALKRFDRFARSINDAQLRMYHKKDPGGALRAYQKVSLRVLDRPLPEAVYRPVHDMWLTLISDVDFLVEYLKDQDQILYEEALALQEKFEDSEPKRAI